MEKLHLWVGLVLVLISGCSGSSTSAQGASGVTPAQMAGTWNYVHSPSYQYSAPVSNDYGLGSGVIP